MLVSSVNGITSSRRIPFSSKKDTYVNYQYYRNNSNEDKTDSYKKSHKKLKTALIATAASIVAIVGIGLIAAKTNLLDKHIKK